MDVTTEIFPHVRVVMGMVVGLGIARLLTGLADIVQHPGRRVRSTLHLLWLFSVLLSLVLFWWWELELIGISQWTFGIFLYIIGYATVLYMQAALLFPSDLGEYRGYEDFFLKRRAWFFVAWALSMVLDIGDTWIKGPEYIANLTPWYLAQAPVAIALAAIAIWTENRAFHYALVAAHLGYQAFWIALLFYTPV